MNDPSVSNTNRQEKTYSIENKIDVLLKFARSSVHRLHGTNIHIT